MATHGNVCLREWIEFVWVFKQDFVKAVEPIHCSSCLLTRESVKRASTEIIIWWHWAISFVLLAICNVFWYILGSVCQSVYFLQDAVTLIGFLLWYSTCVLGVANGKYKTLWEGKTSVSSLWARDILITFWIVRLRLQRVLNASTRHLDYKMFRCHL